MNVTVFGKFVALLGGILLAIGLYFNVQLKSGDLLLRQAEERLHNVRVGYRDEISAEIEAEGYSTNAKYCYISGAIVLFLGGALIAAGSTGKQKQ